MYKQITVKMQRPYLYIICNHLTTNTKKVLSFVEHVTATTKHTISPGEVLVCALPPLYDETQEIKNVISARCRHFRRGSGPLWT